ncbi:MAG: SPOR domain-containing protein [Candidatus Omnitrophota bacterium]
MEKQDYSQLDLFNKAEDSGSSAQRLSGTFLSYIRTYERLVLMLIGLVITGVVCFCVGVEKGKHIALTRVNANLDIAYRNGIVPPPVGAGVRGRQVQPGAAAGAAAVFPRAGSGAAQAPLRMNPPSVRVAPIAVQPVDLARTGAKPGNIYTIQVATYEGKVSAQQELAALKEQGLLPVLRPSGKYIVLSVGNFPDQATAKSVLTKLKRKYRDCYIRRL